MHLVAYQGIVFADVIDIISSGIGIVKASIASIWRVFFILGPGDACLFKNIDNRCHRCRDGAKVIVTDPKVVSTNDGDVILMSEGMK
jgi:hypothetical protein